jgi:hypothetical protein
MARRWGVAFRPLFFSARFVCRGFMSVIENPFQLDYKPAPERFQYPHQVSFRAQRGICLGATIDEGS